MSKSFAAPRPIRRIAARRVFKSPNGKSVALTLGVPQPVRGSDWGCALQITGLDSSWRRAKYVFGIDGLQALHLAMKCASAVLESSKVELKWLGQEGDLGMPRFLPELPKAQQDRIEALVEVKRQSSGLRQSVGAQRRPQESDEQNVDRIRAQLSAARRRLTAARAVKLIAEVRVMAERHQAPDVNPQALTLCPTRSTPAWLCSPNGFVLVLGQREFPELGQEQVQAFKRNGPRGRDLHTDGPSRGAVVDDEKAVWRRHCLRALLSGLVR
jgi:hypothetical protein